MFDTVLVVENEAYILEAMTAILDSAGIESFAVQSAKEGVKLFQENHQKIDLVILDWHLPGEAEGDAVLSQFQAIDPDVKVLISTGYDVRIIQESLGERTTAVSILRKPYSAQTLLNAVRQGMRPDGRGTLSA